MVLLHSYLPLITAQSAAASCGRHAGSWARWETHGGRHRSMPRPRSRAHHQRCGFRLTPRVPRLRWGMHEGHTIRANVVHAWRRSLAAGARPPRRGVHTLHRVFLFRLSPKVAMNRFAVERTFRTPLEPLDSILVIF
jgi:hypothetical protein